jgi:hypothetical protein
MATKIQEKVATVTGLIERLLGFGPQHLTPDVQQCATQAKNHLAELGAMVTPPATPDDTQGPNLDPVA